MTEDIAPCVPNDNGQAEILVFIHGPSWTNTMPLNAHAMTVVIPQLIKAGWEMIADKRFARIDVICPFDGVIV